jgi:hypothetical protein
MAFILNSIVYDSAGQTSPSFFSQQHQLFLLNLKISPTSAGSLKILEIFNRFLRVCQEIFPEIFSIGDFTCTSSNLYNGALCRSLLERKDIS